MTFADELIIDSTLVSSHGCPSASGGGRQPIHAQKRVELRQEMCGGFLDHDHSPPIARILHAFGEHIAKRLETTKNPGWPCRRRSDVRRLPHRAG
jgi:hypothetical protein